jgi:hypothetical protein
MREKAMRNLAFATVAAAALAGGALLSGPAQAAALGPSAGVLPAVDSLSLTQQAQFEFGGRKHCWYPDGWKGPGWYWCGYAHRRGLGWGGPAGWHGWEHERREERREIRRERKEERRY